LSASLPAPSQDQLQAIAPTRWHCALLPAHLLPVPDGCPNLTHHGFPPCFLAHIVGCQVSAEEWEGIPDVGDRTIKKRPRFASFAPAPDSLLSKAAAATQMDSTIAADGLATPAGSQTTADLTAIGETGWRARQCHGNNMWEIPCSFCCRTIIQNK